jgi:predicted Zn-ribbon and HTH transcriptional regulator
MYWLRLVIKSYGLSLRKPVRLYCSGISSPYEIPTYQILLSHIFVIIIALLVLGIRFHSVHNHERIVAYLKEKNLPTTLYELKNLGETVPDEENLALKYLELQKIYKLARTRMGAQSPRCRHCPEEKIQLSEEELKLIDEIRMAYEKCTFYIKELNIPKRCPALPESYNFLENLQYEEPFPDIFYKSTKIYFDTYGKYFAQSLKDISKLNLTKSYYGKNIGKIISFWRIFWIFWETLKNIEIYRKS